MESIKSFFKRNARLLTVTLCVLLIFMAVNSLWVANNFYNAEKFSSNISSVLNKEEVRQAIGNQVSSELYSENPVLDRVLGDPTQSLVASLLASNQFQNIFNNLAEKFNAYVIQGDQQDVIIDLSSTVGIVQNVATTIDPEFEPKLDADDFRIVLLREGDVPDFRGVGLATLLLGPYALIMLLIVFIVAWRKLDPKRELARLSGITFVISAALLFVVAWTEATLLRAAVSTTNGQIVVQAIYDSFTSNLYSFILTLFMVGLLLIFTPKAYDFVKARDLSIKRPKRQ